MQHHPAPVKSTFKETKSVLNGFGYILNRITKYDKT